MYCRNCGRQTNSNEELCDNCNNSNKEIIVNSNDSNIKSTIKEARSKIANVENFILGIFFSIIIIACMIPARKDILLLISLIILLILPVCEILRSGYLLFNNKYDNYNSLFKKLNILKYLSLLGFVALIILKFFLY